jgi:hypothetical protein
MGLSRKRGWTWLSLLLCAQFSMAQPAPRHASRERLEFPLELRQKIVAGQTPAGSAVEAKLVIATLVRGVVIPEGAMFSGTVEESVARAGNTPSRLRIHITAAKWNAGSMTVNLYITNTCYPHRRSALEKEDSLSGLQKRQDEILQAQQHGGVIPMLDTEKPGASSRYEHRTVLEDTKGERDEDGRIAILSEKSNLKLDAGRVYGFEGSAGK